MNENVKQTLANQKKERKKFTVSHIKKKQQCCQGAPFYDLGTTFLVDFNWTETQLQTLKEDVTSTEKNCT